MRQEGLHSLERRKFMEIGGRIEDFSCNFLKYLTSSPCRHKSVFPKTVLPEGDGV